MSAMKIKKGDTVTVIAGKDKGKEGKVLAVNVKDNTVLVENVNMVTKHTKPSAANQNGGIVTKEAPLHISNVMLMADGKATREQNERELLSMEKEYSDSLVNSK